MTLVVNVRKLLTMRLQNNNYCNVNNVDNNENNSKYIFFS